MVAASSDDATTDDAATTVPGAPTGLTATASGSTRINLSWTAPADNGGSAITGYTIEVSPNGTSSSWTDRVANTGTTTTTYSHTGLSAGTTRHYRVSAINSVGTGAASNIDDATTDDAATTVPGAPTGLTATASGSTRINLSWTAPADNGGSAITGYTIEVSPNGTSSSWTDRVANTGTTTTTYSHTGLSAGTTRHYRVSAINSVGTGAASNIDDATTDDAEEPPTVPIVSVFDVRVDEEPGAVLAFPVRLKVAAVETATITWETLNGAGNKGAKAGKDYKADKGTLLFSPGEKEKTIRVKVIDDEKHEGTEVMLLMLLDAQGAEIDDAVAKGTIEDDDAASAAADAADDALAAAEGLTPDEAADALFGERRLSEARLAALDRLGNRNGRYDLGDLLAWIERCRRGEAHCGPTSTGSGPPSAAGLLAAAAAGRLWISRRTRRRGSGRPERKPIRAARRRGRFAGYALATLLAVTMTLSCTEGSVGPAANVQDPGFLTVEWTGPAAGRGIGVLLELEGPGIEAVRAPGFELYESRASGRHEIVVAGSLRAGPLVQFRVPDRGQLPLYRVRVLEVAGEDYELRDAGQYRAVITLH